MIENLKLVNTVSNQELKLSTTETPNYILGEADLGTVQSTLYSYKYVNQIGRNITGSSYEMRNIYIIGWIVADTKIQMTDLKNLLNRFVNPKNMIDVFYKNYKISFLPDTSVLYASEYYDNNEVICKFKISGVCPYPLFSDINIKRVSSSVFKPEFRFPLVFKPLQDGHPPKILFGNKIVNNRIELINDGSVPTGVIATFVAKTGEVVNPKVTNVNTGDFFKLNKTLKLSEQVFINTNTGSKSVTGKEKNGEILNYFKYLDYGSSWMQLDVGANDYEMSADKGVENLEFTIDFSNKYLEVQEWD